MQLSKIHATRWGETGPRVVMVHGGMQGSEIGGTQNFANQERLSEKGWQLVVPDRPGHGKSPDPGRPDDAEADGMWVSDLLGDRAHLIGHSFGACVALAATARRPDAVQSLTLIEPGMQKLAIDDPRVRKFVLRLLMTSWFSFSPVTKAVRIMNMLGIPPEIRGRYDRDTLRRLGVAFGRGKLPDKETLTQQLGGVADAGIPLMVISGGWSEGFDATAERVAAVGGGRHIIVKSPHHFPQIVSGPFNDVFLEFLTRSETRPA